MSDPATATHTSSDGLWRWLLGGLVAGGVILGLLIAAYAIGYHRGQHHPRAAAPPPPRPRPRPTTTTATTTAPSPTIGPVAVTPALVARGKTPLHRRRLLRLPLAHRQRRCRPQLQRPRRQHRHAHQRPDRHRRRRLPRALDHRPRRPDRQGLPRRASCPPRSPATTSTGKPDDIRALVAFIKSHK